MRLWHEELLDKLPRQQLLGQHREVAALLGQGWEKNHSTIDYIFNYSLERLKGYHYKVMKAMLDRGYNPSEEWFDHQYRGKQIGIDESLGAIKGIADKSYPEHDLGYLVECIENMMDKGCVCKYVEDYT